MCLELCGDEGFEEDDSNQVELISEQESFERFDDFLNECWETIFIMGMPYDPSRVLKEVDPIRYREDYNNWLDNELQEGSFKLEQDL